MDFSDFWMMGAELRLLAIFVVLLAFDIFAGSGSDDAPGGTSAMRWFRPVAIALMAVHTVWGFLPAAAGAAFGEMYVTNATTALMKNVLDVATLIVMLQAGGWLRGEGQRVREGEFYVILLATLLGMYLMVSATNFMLMYLGIEIASLPMACLAAYDKHRERSAEAGAKYILMTALASGVMMFGLSYLYGAMGTMYFGDMTGEVAGEPMTLLGMVFFFAGLGFKISLVPFHAWAPDVYEGAPTATTAYLSVVSKAAAVFTLMIVLGQVFSALAAVWYWLLWGVAVLTIVVGNLFAMRQTDVKRFFAYSSISQAGYIVLGMLHGWTAGGAAVVYFVFAYVFSNLAAFGVIAAMGSRTQIADYRGLYKSNPRLALVMMLAVFSLAGIPPLAGFFSKFFIFAAAASGGAASDYALVLIALLNTVVSLYYYLKIVRAMFIDPPLKDAVPRLRTDGYLRASLVICTAGMLVVGVASWFLRWISAAM